MFLIIQTEGSPALTVPVDDLSKPLCSACGCSREAVWRQYEPVDPTRPLRLCAEHWNLLRHAHYELSAKYGALRYFPEE